jgi:hypothetical protein
MILAYLERPVESTIALLTAVAGIPAYFFFTRRSGSGMVHNVPDLDQESELTS